MLFVLTLSLALSFAPKSAEATKNKPPRVIQLHGANTVTLTGHIDYNNVDITRAAIVQKRLFLAQDETLYLIIASPGGEYPASLVLKSFMAQVPNMQVICKYCASAAGMLFATFPGKRLSMDKSIVLMHEMHLPRTTAKIAQDGVSITSLIRSSEEFDKLMYDVIGISRKEYEAKITNTEWIVRDKESVKLKLADEFVVISCDAYMKAVAPQTCGG
jgi:ATP-dependent protease ClpP protease subunit